MTQFVEQRQAILTRHVLIQKHDIEALDAKPSARAGNVLRRDGAMFTFKDASQGITRTLFVVNNEDRPLLFQGPIIADGRHVRRGKRVSHKQP